jgi:alpha,alpha-trehalase
MGPDEFHTAYPDADPDEAGGIDNNAYTNVMASWVLQAASDVLDRLSQQRRIQLCEALALGDEEIEHWYEISRKLRVVFHGDGLISQFQGYDDLEEFEWEAYREKYGDIQRLDRILEAEGDTPNRYKLSKQPDALMLFYLFSADQLELLFEHLGYPFDPASIPRNIKYYLQRSTEGSSLSRSVHSWLLARLDRSASWDLFQEALDSDFRDIQGGTTPEGIHTGAMAGTIDLVQRCYTGLEQRAGILHFDPMLPDALQCLRLKINYRRHRLGVEIDHDQLRVQSCPVSNLPVQIAYRGHVRELAPGDSVSFRLLRPEDRDRSVSRSGPRMEAVGGSTK